MGNKSALVTGGAGFIGSHLCEVLLRKKYRVICVDNFLTGDRQNVKALMDQSGFLLVNADVTKKLPEVLLDEPVDYVYHLASPASPNEKSPISYLSLPLETMDVNSLGTRRMLRLSKKKKARFVYASTSEVYGDPKVHPQTEDYWGNVNPRGVRACYDESKRFGEALTMVYVRKFKLDARIVRIFNTYGPRMDLRDGRAVVNFITQALKNEPLTIHGKGSQTRSFCYVDDLVKGLIKLAETDNLTGEVVNLGSTEELTVLDMAKKVKRATKSKSEFTYTKRPDDDPRKRRPDMSKARRLLGWTPNVGFSQGLKKTIAYFEAKLRDETVTA